MKFKLTVFLTAVVVALGLLLSASTAQAAPEVIFEGNNATGIKNLEVDGKLYNVEFLFDSAENIYGASPIFDFQDGIEAASSAVIAALNSEPAVTTVGPEKDNVYKIGYLALGAYVVVTQDYYQASDGPWAQEYHTVEHLTELITYADFTDLSPPMPPPGAPIPKTGQRISYYPGDDGDLQKGVPWPDPRFTDNLDGTVTDNLTGLIWLRTVGYASALWTLTFDWASKLADGISPQATSDVLRDGSLPGDWRVPNVRELESLIDIGNRNPALPTGHPFDIGFTWGTGCVSGPGGRCGYYWTSSTEAPAPQSEVRSAWTINLMTGERVAHQADANGEIILMIAVRDGN